VVVVVVVDSGLFAVTFGYLKLVHNDPWHRINVEIDFGDFRHMFANKRTQDAKNSIF
jgi:hypothetical protein